MRAWLYRLIAAAFIAVASISTTDAQGDSTLYLVSYLEAAPASQGQVVTMLTQLADESRKEGPVRYEVLQRTTYPSQFVILEIWKDQPAADAHAAAAHTRQFRDQVAPLLVAPIDQRLCVATAVAPPREGRGTVYAVTHIDVGPPVRENAARLIQAFAEQSRNDAGNLRFDVTHEKAKTNHFTVIDAWADQKSADNHQVTRPTRTFRAQLAPMLGALYDQRWYKPL